MAVDLLIEGAVVITMDAERRVLPGGAVAVSGNRIAAVLDAGQPRPDAGRTIRPTGGIVLPGLVDSHGHAGHALTKGLGDGFDGDAWMALMAGIYDHASDLAFWRAESALAALERLTFGVTTSVSMTGSAPRIDDPAIAVAAASGYRDLGLRHVIAAGPPAGEWPRRYTSRTPAGIQHREVSLDDALSVTAEIVEELNDAAGGRLRAYVGPSALVSSVNDETATAVARKLADIVARYNTGLHTHAYRGMVRAAATRFPDLLGPRTSLAHCAGIDADEVAMLADTGTSASHGPLTHAFAEARFPLIEALEAGVNVAISTDGNSPDRSFDLLAQARVAAQLQRAHFADTTLLPAGRLLAMITIDAARALSLDKEVGSLEVGKRADVIVVDGGAAHLAPFILAPHRLVHHTAGQDVTTVMCDGRVLMQDRTIPGVDRDEIVANAASALAETLARTSYGDPDRLHPDFWHGLRYRPLPG